MKLIPTLRQLRFVTAVVQRRHFGRAAEDCLVSQSTLSAGIGELEGLLGVRLLERTKRSVQPTAIGVLVAEQAQKVLKAAEDLVDLATDARDPASGPLRLGVIPTIGPFLAPQAMTALRETFPMLKLYLREEPSARLVAGVEHGVLDGALLAKPYDIGGLESLDLAIDPFFIVCPPGHRLSGTRPISFHDLAREDLLLLEEGHCLRDHALAACHLDGAKGNVVFQGMSLHTLVQMVRSGLGITLLPQMALDAGILRDVGLEAAPLEADAPHRTVSLVWRRASGRRETMRRLAACLSAQFRRAAQVAPIG